MLFKEYCKSLKTPNYDKNFISEKKKICIDEMLEQNISYDVIICSNNISEKDFMDYFNNEWCYRNPERYFNIVWVQWVNLFNKEENVFVYKKSKR